MHAPQLLPVDGDHLPLGQLIDCPNPFHETAAQITPQMAIMHYPMPV
jgi:hypothetical protein